VNVPVWQRNQKLNRKRIPERKKSMKWKHKARIQSLLSAIPGGMAANTALSRIVGQMRKPEGRVLRIFEKDVTVIFQRIPPLATAISQASVLEIGTGWQPVLPLCFSLVGFRHIHTYDINKHLTTRNAYSTLKALEGSLSDPSLTALSSAKAIADRYAQLRACTDVQQLLRAARIDYHAPADAAETQLPDQSVDLIVSNNVFEHISARNLKAILAESRRVLKRGGYILHCVNCGDHYAYSDASVTQINYLQYSEEEWKRWNPALHYQNRLRPKDFVEMASEAGFAVERAEYAPQKAMLDRLAKLNLAPEFQHYPASELASTSLTLIARRA
jgi:predicted SAM-dependent methyltransferase